MQDQEGWRDHFVSFGEIIDKGFVAEFDRLPDHLDGDAKNEIAIIMPSSVRFEEREYILNWCLFHSEEMALDLSWHEHHGRHRILLNVSDRILNIATIYVAYTPDGTSRQYGYRYIFQLKDVIEYTQQDNAAGPVDAGP